MSEPAAWHLDDVAEYDSTRELGNALIASLWAQALVDDEASVELDEIAQVRAALLAVAGSDRAEIRKLSETLSRRLRELQE